MSLDQTRNSRNFEFTGNAKEWFGIWIVNLLLSIVTIGIYSAWAKVRTKKYFHNNTHVDGRNFDYHATGGQIFKGRMIVLAGIIVFQIIVAMLPLLGAGLLLLMLAIYPWLITRAMMFNARMTSFSNVRFNFVGTTGRAFMVYLLYPFLCALTLYTTFPILDRAMKKFSINNHRLGTAPFSFDAPTKAFYKAAGWALLWVLAVAVLAGSIVSMTSGSIEMMFAEAGMDQGILLAITLVFYIVIFAGLIPAAFIYKVLTRNLVYNGTIIEGGHQLRSNVKAGQLFWIAVSNMGVVICTLGLMLPWAQIRMSRYLAAHTSVVLGASLDEFVGGQQEAVSALGDAYSDIEGIDIGLPI